MTLLRWTERLSERDRRALGLLAVVSGLASAYALVLRPVAADLASMRVRVERSRDAYRQEIALQRESSRWRQAFDHGSESVLRAAPLLFVGGDSVTATADLTSYVTGLAAINRVFVQGSEPADPVAEDTGLVRVRVALRAVSDMAGIAAWLSALERGAKLVRVAELSLSPASPIGLVSGSAGLLGASLVLEGLVLIPADSASSESEGQP